MNRDAVHYCPKCNLRFEEGFNRGDLLPCGCGYRLSQVPQVLYNKINGEKSIGYLSIVHKSNRFTYENITSLQDTFTAYLDDIMELPPQHLLIKAFYSILSSPVRRGQHIRRCGKCREFRKGNSYPRTRASCALGSRFRMRCGQFSMLERFKEHLFQVISSAILVV